MGDTVRELRLSRGLTQQRLATDAGLSLRTLSRVERGEDMTLSTLRAIADQLGVPVADLVTIEQAS